MKQFILTLLLVFSFSLNAQYVIMTAVDLNEGAEQDYLKLEEFYSEIHKEAVKQGLRSGQSVWKRTPKEGDEDSAPEYFIFDNFSSMEQMQNQINYQELAEKVYKGKMSRRSIQRMLNTDSTAKDRRGYVLEAVDFTILAGGSVKPGDKATINLMNKKTEDFEKYESEVWKPVAEKNILNGNLRQWAIVKLIDKSDNAYDGWSHMAWNLRGDNPGEWDGPTGFKWNKLWEGIESSRDMTDATELTCVFTVE